MLDWYEMKRGIQTAIAGFSRANEKQARWFKGANFMTPDIWGIFAFQKGKYLAEVSSGRGIGDYYIYGVTVLVKHACGDYRTSNDLSRCLMEPQQVREYLEILKTL